MKESFRGVKMFKNKIVSSIKEFAIDLRSDIHPVLFFKWLFWKIVFFITVAFVMLGIALIIGFLYDIITFNQRIMTPNAVILYRSKLPAKLTKKESKEWADIKALQKKLNKISGSYQLSQIKKLKPLFAEKR
jgi:hypothetical protein